jgi:hypothetical protein
MDLVGSNSSKFDSARLSNHGFDQIESGHLMSDNFGFWVILDRVGLVIETSSIESFQFSGHIRSGWDNYRLI